MCQFPILHSTLTGPVDIFFLKRLLCVSSQSSHSLPRYSLKFIIKYDIIRSLFGLVKDYVHCSDVIAESNMKVAII